LRDKHPYESSDAIKAAAVEALKKAKQRLSSGEFMNPEFTMDELRDALVAVICRGNFNSAPGPDGLRYLHLQQLLNTKLSTQFAQVYTDYCLMMLETEYTEVPDLVWKLHTMANLTALGTKKRPLACGFLDKRLIGSMYLQLNRAQLSAAFEAHGQHCVGTAAGAELIAVTLQIQHHAGNWIEALDVKNAFNSVKRQSLLEGLVDYAPSLVNYVAGTHAQVVPELLYHTRGGNQVVESQTGSQQGCSLGGLLFCCGLSIPLRAGRARVRTQAGLDQQDTVAFADDMFTAVADPAAPQSQCEFDQFGRGLAAIGCDLEMRKLVYLPPLGM
jgi:Reverse transcriptase (RNA-dependent DNA polymerase)